MLKQGLRTLDELEAQEEKERQEQELKEKEEAQLQTQLATTSATPGFSPKELLAFESPSF